MEAITDSEKLDRFIKALKLSKTEFASKLGLKSHVTIYNVINGKNDMTHDIINRILVRFPAANSEFLTKGIGEPLLTGAKAHAQANIMGNADVSLNEFLDIPLRVRNIEQHINDIPEIKQELSEIKNLLKEIAKKLLK